MPEITDEFMKQMLATTKSYTAVILKKSSAFKMPDVFPVIWEHGRRNFSLREDGILMIVCPISEDKEMAGIGIFNADAEKTKAIMDEDPAVKAGVLVYEIYPTRSFPGDSLKS
ncbi:MAG: hypothetical protein JST87_11745 [Bacteroidetes bacterium]|nr:hypothetical protein [Bacteroidota bacterium]MBS1935698.1 hypothetical protein [Bacteroidota bacterium]